MVTSDRSFSVLFNSNNNNNLKIKFNFCIICDDPIVSIDENECNPIDVLCDVQNNNLLQKERKKLEKNKIK